MVCSFELVGAPCAVRGPYTFYKAFKYTKNDITNIIAINEFFFVKLWNDSDLISIGELRLLWEDKNCNAALASLRLYILPENTPEGRSSGIHGEDEVLAITEKVVIKLNDLLTWITEATDWSWGMGAVWRQHCIVNDKSGLKQSDEKINGSVKDVDDHDDEINTLVDCSAVDYSDVRREKNRLDMTNWNTRTGVIVLSYSRYCRYRGLLKRLEGVHNEWLRNKLITALGGFTATCRTTKVLFCRDTFDYPDLEGHELLCNHLAPKLKSGVQKKKKVLTSSEASETDSSYGCSDDENGRQSSSVSSSASINSHKSNVTNRSAISVDGKQENTKAIPVTTSLVSQKIIRPPVPENERKQKAFIQNLYSFMKARLTPIGRLPQIGNREINLFEFFNKVKRLGGHSSVTHNKRWRIIFEELGGEQGNPAAPTLARKHYEKFLLPYELHMAQQFKHSASQYSVRQSVEAPNHSASGSKCDKRLRVDVKKQANDVKTNRETTKSGETEVPRDKENIPFADRQRLISNSQITCEVIDLCEADDSSSSGGISQASSMPYPKDNVAGLCEESPIKRSVPSIAATLIPKKRKLDILKEGGLEVTPVSVTIGNSSSRDTVTITRKTVSSMSRSNEKCDVENVSDDGSVEILDPEDYYSSSKSTSNQVLDLRIVNNDWVSYENNLLKKISPSLGPNIEISLVPNDGMKRDEKRQKQVQMPALRRISAGQVSAKNVNNNNQQKHKRTASACGSWKDEMKLNPTKQSIFSTSVADASARFSSVPPYASNVNQSLYLAALYNSIFPASAGSDFIDKSSTENDISVGNRHQLELSHQQLSCFKNSFLHSQPESEEQEFDDKAITISNSFAQKFSNILKNNTISIIENYEKILPD